MHDTAEFNSVMSLTLRSQIFKNILFENFGTPVKKTPRSLFILSTLVQLYIEMDSKQKWFVMLSTLIQHFMKMNSKINWFCMLSFLVQLHIEMDSKRKRIYMLSALVHHYLKWTRNKIDFFVLISSNIKFKYRLELSTLVKYLN